MESAFLKWDISEPKNFNRRLATSMAAGIIVFAFIGIFGGSNLIEGILIFTIFFLFYFYVVWNREKHYITYMCFDTDSIKIVYKKESMEMNAEGPVSEFAFKKKMAFSKSRIPHLLIYFNNKRIVNQYETGEWNEKKFDELIRQFELLNGAYYSPL